MDKIERSDLELATDEKLTDWKKEPSVRELKADLEAAKPAHQTHVTNIKRWNDLRNVEGKYRPKPQKNRSQVQPKLIRRQNEWRYSALSEPFLSSEKLFEVNPVTFEDKPAAEQNELVLNWQFRTKLNKVAFIDEYVRTAVDEGSVIVRLGWHRETRMVDTEVPIYEYVEIQDPALFQQLEELIALKEQNPRGFNEAPEELKEAVEYFLETGIPVTAHVVGYETVEEEELIENKPTIHIVDPENFYIDPSCQGDLDKAGFVVTTFETSKAELLKDGRYQNLDAVNWSSSSILAQPDHKTETPTDFDIGDELRKRVVAYEYWGFIDVEGNEELTPIVATWIGDTMVRLEENPFPDEKIPFVVVPYLPVRRQLMGEPDAEILEDNQAILGAVTRGMIDLMGRSANSQQGIAKGLLDTVNRRRYEQGLDYEFNQTQGGPQSSIYQHTYPEVPNSALTMINLQNQEAEALSGVKSFHGGISGEAYGEVATGIRGVLDASSKREMNILRRLAQGIKQIGEKIIAMNAIFLSEEEVVRVTNEEFVSVRREDLKGNFDLIVDISTAEVDESKSQDLGFMLQTMGPNMDPMMSQMILSDIAKLKRMPTLAKMIMDYRPEPDPILEELKQLEVLKLRKEIEKLDSEIRKNLADANVKASDADLKDLDFVEQESGTKHERDLQKHSAQAEANQQLEITKALLNPPQPQQTEERSPTREALQQLRQSYDPNRLIRSI